MKMQWEVYEFSKGQIIGLDDIYIIQGLAGGDWWEHHQADFGSVDYIAEQVIITRSVEIRVGFKNK